MANSHLFGKKGAKKALLYRCIVVTTLLLIVIYLSFISLGLPDSLLGSAWPAIYGSLGVPLSYAGLATIVTMGGTVTSSVLSARLIKRFGTGTVTAVSVALTAAALLGISFTNNFYVLCLLMVPLGFGGGSVDAALNNYVALHYKAKHMSWLHCFWGIGATLGPIVMSAALTGLGSWQAGYRAVSFLQISLVAAFLFSLPLWNKVAIKKREEEGGKTPIPAPASQRATTLPGAKAVLFAFFCYCAIEYTAGLWGSSYLVTMRGIEKEVSARWISLYYLGITAGRFLSGFLTFKLSSRSMVNLGCALLGAGILLLLLPCGNALLMPAFFLMGLGCAPVFPSLLHETPKNFGAENSQSVMGLQMALAYVGGTVMPPLFGFLATYLTNALFPFYLLALLLMMIIAVQLLNRRVDAKR